MALARKRKSDEKDDPMLGKREPEFHFERVGNQVLRTAIWRGSDPHARALLFFNGIGANIELMAPLAEAIRDRDIITFDMPGVGKSPDPVVPYRPWWVAYAARRILKRHGHSECDVIGVSWGGGAAQQFAFQYRNVAKKLILAATTSGMTMVPGNVDVLSKMASPKRYVSRDYLMQNFQKLYGDADSVIKDHAINIIAPSMRGYFYQLMAMIGWTSLPFLPFLPQPTLILAGDRDKIVPLINAKVLKRFIRKSHLHVVPGGGHLFIVSRINEIMPVIKDFLGGPDDAAPELSAYQPA